MPETLRQEYRQFLAKSFCGLRLRQPLFYNWKYGLRIDLQDESLLLRDIELRGSAYFEEVTRRAGLIFNTAFDASDDVIIMYMDVVDKRGRIRFHNYAFRQIDGLRKDEVQFTNESNLYKTQRGRSFLSLIVIFDRRR
jgi:PAS domain-containing protein